MTIRRHTTTAIFLHWFNAVCWIALLGSGFGLLQNSDMQPVGQWWAALWSTLPTLYIHQVIGIVWALTCTVLALTAWRSVSSPFLREIFTLSPRQDAIWCWRKGLHLILGEACLHRMGLNAALPPQGFYNAGQKYVAILAVLSSVLLILSGLALFLAPVLTGAETLVQWAIWLHFCCAGCMAVTLPVHIYMAALAPGEKPALLSMLHGHVPMEFVRHHNPLWYAELQKKMKLH